MNLSYYFHKGLRFFTGSGKHYWSDYNDVRDTISRFAYGDIMGQIKSNGSAKEVPVFRDVFNRLENDGYLNYRYRHDTMAGERRRWPSLYTTLTSDTGIFGGGYSGYTRRLVPQATVHGVMEGYNRALKEVIANPELRDPKVIADLQKQLLTGPLSMSPMVLKEKALGLGETILGGSAAQRAAKVGAVTGLMAMPTVISGTTRMATGNGDFLHDRNGNFDIAGIPFI